MNKAIQAIGQFLLFPFGDPGELLAMHIRFHMLVESEPDSLARVLFMFLQGDPSSEDSLHARVTFPIPVALSQEFEAAIVYEEPH